MVERKNNVKLLCDLLSEGAVLCPLSEKEKWAAIEACLRAHPRISSGAITFEESLSSIREREKEEQTTMLENGVAIPHGILPDPAPLLCMLGVSPEGVLYSSVGEKAHIIFTILGSRSVRRDYLGVLAQIARLFRGPDLKEKILKAKTPDEVLNLLREAERL